MARAVLPRSTARLAWLATGFVQGPPEPGRRARPLDDGAGENEDADAEDCASDSRDGAETTT